MYNRIIFFLIIIVFSSRAQSQEVSVPELTAMVRQDQFSVDTLMKHKGYRLMQKDIDSVSAQYYYSHLERNETGPSWVRALSYIDVNLKDVSSRVLTYRTYNRDEYVKMMAAMLAKGYKTTDVFDFKDSKHTVFDDGKQPIRVKVTNNNMEDGRKVRSYEFELGR